MIIINGNGKKKRSRAKVDSREGNKIDGKIQMDAKGLSSCPSAKWHKGYE